ncbi:MAG: AraC family transcriptional regulator [Bacilli bacterium]|nr:AraC family transcriptional regulator [Bacilli bacterium]
MAIKLDHQLREQIPYDITNFPITLFYDELISLPNYAGPLHWHPDFEIATALSGVLDFQIGRQHIVLEAGDSIFINKNVLHRIKQLSGKVCDSVPNIVFSATFIASETSIIYNKYIQQIASCDTLPFIVFKSKNRWHNEVNSLLKNIYYQMYKKNQCYEMIVQRDLSKIFEYIFINFEKLPKSESTRVQINTQIRIQKMLLYIYDHYNENITLKDIAASANISRSEAGRCFNTCMGCSPIEALIQYRLQIAHKLLNDTTLTIQEISYSCGFNSVNYFSRKFQQTYGYTPSKNRHLGK